MTEEEKSNWYRELGKKGGKKGVKNPKKGFGGMTKEQIQAAWEKRRVQSR